jgi:outer membrane protein assembly factor BamD
MKRIIVVIAFCVACNSIGTLYAKDWLWTPESGQWISEKDIEKRSARLQYEKARELESIGDVKGAVRQYARLVRQYPASVYAPDAQYMVGILKEGEGDFYGAFKEYARVIDNYPSYKRFLEIVEREYRIGNLYLAGEKTSFAGMKILPGKDKAIEVFQHIVRSAPYSSFAPRAQFNIGEAYRSIKRYAEAVPEYQRVVNVYPESELVIEASYQIAMCGYQRSQDAPYDQTSTNIAMGAMKDFLRKYAKSRKAPEVRSKLNILMERKASKSYDIAKFYDKEGSDEAAIIYYQDVINEFPGSQLAIKAEKRIDEIIIKPTSKKYEDKIPGAGFLSKLKMPAIAIPNPFAGKTAVTQQAPAAAAAHVPAVAANEKGTDKHFWEIWKKSDKTASVKKETPPAEKKTAEKDAKKKFWEVWKQDKKETSPQESALGEEGTLTLKDTAGRPDEQKMAMAAKPPSAAGESTLPLTRHAQAETKKAGPSEPAEDEIEKELMGDTDAQEPSGVKLEGEIDEEPLVTGRKETLPGKAHEDAQASAAAAAEDIAGEESAPAQAPVAEIPKELDVVQIVDLKLVETTKGSKIVFVLNKPAQFAVYELKDPMRLMIAMKSPVYSKLDDRIDINRSGIKSVRNHYRNKEETENGWQVNAVVFDFDRNVTYNVKSDDTSISIEIQ